MKRTGLALLLLAAGCTPKAPVDAAPAACSADAVRGSIGQTYSPALGEAMRKTAGAASIRALSPDSMATKDYRIDRLNIRLDAGGIVTRADCG